MIITKKITKNYRIITQNMPNIHHYEKKLLIILMEILFFLFGTCKINNNTVSLLGSTIKQLWWQSVTLITSGNNTTISTYRKKLRYPLNNYKKKLVPGFPVFRKAFLTVNWSPFGGFEGHFTFLTTI